MNLDNVKPGEWPNIAITPGTDKHAATGERVKLPSTYGEYKAQRATEWTNLEPNDGLNAESDVAKQAERSNDENVDTRGIVEAAALNLVDNLRSYGWKYAGDPEREINELLDRQATITEQSLRGKIRTIRKQNKKYRKQIGELTAERDEWKAKAEESERAMNEAVGKWAQADADKRELDEANEYHKLQYEAACEDADHKQSVIDALVRQRDDLVEHRKAQREELARLNAQVRGKRQIPKKVMWPRFADGKLVKPGRDCSEVVLGKSSYSIWSRGDEEFGAKYGEPVPDTWRESEWRQ